MDICICVYVYILKLCVNPKESFFGADGCGVIVVQLQVENATSFRAQRGNCF